MSGLAPLAGASLLGGGAYLSGKLLNKYVNTPDRLIAPIETKLQGIQSNFPSLKGTSTEELPGLIKGQQDIYSQRLKSIDSNVRVATNNLKSRVEEFNKTVLSKNLDDLAITAKTGAPKLFESAYESYGAGLDAIDGFMSDKGVSFTNKDMSKLIGDVKDKAIRNGVPESRLAIFTKLEEGLSPKEIDITKPIKFRNAKNIIDNITRNSDDETRYITKELWGNLVEKNAPIEVKDQLTKMNGDFSKFAKARYELNRIAKMKSGEYNIEGLRKFFTKYADDMAQTDKQNLINLLTEGQGIVKPIEGLKGKVGELSKNVAKKLTLEEALDKIGKVSLQKRQTIMQHLESFTKWSTKAKELLAEKSAIIKKYPIRSSISGGKFVGNIARKFLGSGIKGLAPSVLDPQGIMLKSEFGTSDPIEIISRIIGKKPSEEEIQRVLNSKIA
jgi:DNA-directed RNA polymerase subunit F